MANEFKPLVPSTHKGKASFSISNNRINRVSVSSGAATSYVSSQDTATPQERGGEVAVRRGGILKGGVVTKVGAGETRQLQPIVPRISKPSPSSSSGPGSQKVLLNTSGSAKYLLVNTSQMKPPLNRTRRDSVPHIAIKRPSSKPAYTPILPHSAPPHRPVPSLEVGPHSRHRSGDSDQAEPSSRITDPSMVPVRYKPGPPMPKQPVTGAIDGGIYPRPKKPCNCTKSMCLKLYCDCFANGEFCSGCNCQNCHNNISHESER